MVLPAQMPSMTAQVSDAMEWGAKCSSYQAHWAEASRAASCRSAGRSRSAGLELLSPRWATTRAMRLVRLGQFPARTAIAVCVESAVCGFVARALRPVRIWVISGPKPSSSSKA
jgi:hypothetical protein